MDSSNNYNNNSNTANTTAGPHNSDLMNKLDPRVDSDLSKQQHGHGVPEGTYGTHNSRAANAMDPRIDSDADGSRMAGGNAYSNNAPLGSTTHGTHGTHGTSEGAHGPHGSRVANAMDPRVDSDRDGSHTAGGNAYGTHGTSTLGGVSHGTHGGNTLGSSTHGTAEGAHGPHGSRVANAMDPRVDSDRDGSRTAGGNAYSSNAPIGSNTLGSSTHGTHGTAEGAHGPHGSRVANAMDPRVDSDRDGSRTAGGNAYSNTHGTSTLGGAAHGTHGSNTLGSSTHGDATGTHGPHGSRVANAADPRVDSDASHTHGTTHTHGADHGLTGTAAGTAAGTHGNAMHPERNAPNTAGPHSKDWMNKLDPRVDSDLDGSKTIGKDKTHA